MPNWFTAVMQSTNPLWKLGALAALLGLIWLTTSWRLRRSREQLHRDLMQMRSEYLTSETEWIDSAE